MGKNITIIGINYYPEDSAIGLYTTQKAEFLAKQIEAPDLLRDIYKGMSKSYIANNDFKNAYLIKEGEILSVKKVLSELEIKDKKEVKNLKKQIRQYKNRPNEWRGWPISISKPIFSNDKQFCVIGFVFGNNGGHTELYKKSNSKWERIGIFNRFAY